MLLQGLYEEHKHMIAEYRVYQPNFPIANSNFIIVNGESWLIEPV